MSGVAKVIVARFDPRRARLVLVVLVLLVLVGAACWAAQASAYIYWTGPQSSGIYSIARANLDGTGVNQRFINGASSPDGIAVDGQYIYWANSGTNSIARANLNGTGVNENFITGADDPRGVALGREGEYIYWTNYGDGTIGRAFYNGTDVDQRFITGAVEPDAVAVNLNYIYWTNQVYGSLSGGSIARANLDGTGADETFITAVDNPTGLALGPNAAYIYWADAATSPLGGWGIGRADYNGTGVNSSFVSDFDIDAPMGVVVDYYNMYWTSEFGQIYRASNDGSAVNGNFMTGLVIPLYLALGPVAAATASSSSVSFGTQLADTPPASGSGHVLTIKNTSPGVLGNTGPAALQMTQAQVTSGNTGDFKISGDTCVGRSVAVGATCTIDLSFAPTAPGPRTAVLKLSSNDTYGPLSIPLSGTGGIAALANPLITGVKHRKPKFAFTLNAATGGAPLNTIAVTAPSGSGLRFLKAENDLVGDIKVRGPHRRRVRFTASVQSRGQVLTIALKAPTSNASITIASPELVASRKLAKDVRAGGIAAVTLTINVTNTEHFSQALSFFALLSFPAF